MKRQSQQGIALVITLILLSVITFMAVTFLVVSRHEGEQVDTLTQRNVSKFAADGMQQQAIAQITANLTAPNNGFNNLGLIVSTNYYTVGGYDPSTAGTPPIRTSPYNVSYTYANGLPLNLADQQQMMNNLMFLPRAPVFISTNRNQGSNEFRFYLDENGNGRFETNGFITNTDVQGNYIPNGAGGFVTSTQVGDPEWVGFLEHPDQRHSASNLFTSRGAFIAVPIGDALDANAIHNQSRLSAPAMTANAPEGFYRNQGVTPAEINLAAFLEAVNTNTWGWQTNGSPGYLYSTNPFQPSQGIAFNDAAAILQYRYGGSYSSLSSFQNLFGAPTVNSYLVNGAVDAYAMGPLMTGVNPPFVPAPPQISANAANPWSGANNPLRLRRPRDLLTLITNTGGNSLLTFTNRLYSAGLGLSTYDRYTFYRMLAQMGFSSAPEPAPYPVGGANHPVITQVLPMPIPNTAARVGLNQMSYGTIPEPYPYVHGKKMNLNWNNLTSTNFVPWNDAAQFFTNAADRLLRTYYPTNFAVAINGGQAVVTNININFIPVYPVNFYTPGVHRALQLAANMYDASTNKSLGPVGFDYPSVFRPIFTKIGSGAKSFVYISGYYEVAPSNSPASYQNAPLDLRRVTGGSVYEVDKMDGNKKADGNNYVDNIYGVPFVVGARPNLPNFNQLSMASVVQVTRSFQLTTPDGTKINTNVSYNIGISNVVGVQCWNSSTNTFSRPGGIRIAAIDDYTLFVSNTFNGAPSNYNAIFSVQAPFTVPIATPGSPWAAGVNMITGAATTPSSFLIPLFTNAIALTNKCYLRADGNYNLAPTFVPLTTNNPSHTWLPDWAVNVTNRLRLVILDNTSGRILDYVQLGGLGQLAGPDCQDSVLANLSQAGGPPGPDIWNTNAISAINTLPIGIFNQLAISENYTRAQQYSGYWVAAPSAGAAGGNSVLDAINKLNKWILSPDPANPAQAPFTFTVNYAKYYTWSANDPLVHYMTGDLTDLAKMGFNATNNRPAYPLSTAQMNNVLTNLSLKSPRYQPWNQNVATSSLLTAITGANQLQYRDPMVRKTSDFLFPGNKYANVGWLGRVHRGTPWQTVYLKSTPVDTTNQPYSTWQLWTGDADQVDATSSQPTLDWSLLDLFTTAPSDNASRGQLSVNQTNLAAWTAALDGVMVMSNGPKGVVAMNIDLTQANPTYGNLVTDYLYPAINAQRAKVAGGVFSSIGQLFSTPQLTVASPYINTSGAYWNDTNLTDAVMERIPQQMASLLRVGTPRYEIYAYGQSLKPADRSIVQSGAFFGMVTNYQITGEVLTRTVVRFDNPPIPLPGYQRPGTPLLYDLPIQGDPTHYAVVTNIVPPMRAVVESFEILGPDQ